MKRVAICIPSGDMVHADFAMSLAALAYRCSALKQDGVSYEAIPLAICNTKGSLVVNNRNRLVQEARELGVDYLFFVDSDIVMHPWTLRRLLDLDKDIVGATYIQREPPHRILGKALDGRLLHDVLIGEHVDTSKSMEVSALPGGCLLVKSTVFDPGKLELPFFQTPAHVTDGVPWIEGEDYFFCRTARAAGFSVWLDWATSIAIGHIGQQVNSLPVAKVEKEEVRNAIVH